MNISDWHSLYSDGWKGEIAPAAFAHPAKFSRALIRHIYKHAIEEGWLNAGDTVVDPFGGVGLGAIDAMLNGLNWVGVELEQKFVDLGNQNIELWNSRYGGKVRTYGTARLIQGDSRELAQVIEQAGACVSSPPYANAINASGEGPGSRSTEWVKVHSPGHDSEKDERLISQGVGYSTNPANLGNLPANDYAAAVSSPPYAEARIGQESGQEQCGRGDQYGATNGQLGAMGAGDYAAAVSSPPFENSMNSTDEAFIVKHLQDIKRNPQSNGAQSLRGHYGDTDGNIGNSTGDGFWTAARQIVEQVHTVLRPGGVAIWVVKSFVKNKQIVDFPHQWQELCEAVGFQTLHEHRAWLVEDKGAQWDLFGELHEKTIQRKSFFRRLAEAKGSPPIDWETVLCMTKVI
jgi:tRNA G10  N-methylase Trm11